MRIFTAARHTMAALTLALGIAGAGLIAPAAAAAFTASSAPPRSLNVVGTDYHFALSTHTLHAGLVTIRLRNAGHDDHQLALARLRRGASEQQFLADIRAGKETTAFGLVDFNGGVNTIAPGQRETAWSRLPAGRYLAVCFVPGPGGVPHLLLGMTATFRVVGHMNHQTPKHVRGSIDAYSFGFGLPQHVDPHGVYRFYDTNRSDPHELAIMRLAPGKSIIDVVDWLQTGMKTAPPGEFDGGAPVVEPHGVAWVRLDLRPGNYIATCFVVDQETGMPHALMGMITPFHVGKGQS